MANFEIIDVWKIQELRAAVLYDLKEFVPSDFYMEGGGEEANAKKDATLSVRLLSARDRAPQKFTPRQFTAVWLLSQIGLYCFQPYASRDFMTDAANGLTSEIIREGRLAAFQDALKRYVAHIGVDEAKAYQILTPLCQTSCRLKILTLG